MKKLIIIPGIFVVFLLSFGAHAETAMRCIVSASGVIAAGDTFALTAAHIQNGGARGSVQLNTPFGYTFQSSHLDQLDCTQRLVHFEGSGRWNGENGFRIVVLTEDRDVPGNADYIEMRVTGSDDNLVYSTAGYLVSGKIRHY